MATKKKTTARRKKTKGRGKVGSTTACKAVGAKLKLGDKVFTIKKYAKTKTEAAKIAESHRKGGKTKLARVAKTACGWRVVTRG